MKLVIVESRYAGDTENNILYARRAVRDCVLLGESPIASHLLFTQPGILQDEIFSERELGIKAGLAWRMVADLQAFYTDIGWSQGMLSALFQCLKEKRELELRALDGPVRLPATLDEDVEIYLKSKIRT